jgi:hypothetical protein
MDTIFPPEILANIFTFVTYDACDYLYYKSISDPATAEYYESHPIYCTVRTSNLAGIEHKEYKDVVIDCPIGPELNASSVSGDVRYIPRELQHKCVNLIVEKSAGPVDLSGFTSLKKITSNIAAFCDLGSIPEHVTELEIREIPTYSWDPHANNVIVVPPHVTKLRADVQPHNIAPWSHDVDAVIKHSCVWTYVINKGPRYSDMKIDEMKYGGQSGTKDEIKSFALSHPHMTKFITGVDSYGFSFGANLVSLEVSKCRQKINILDYPALRNIKGNASAFDLTNVGLSQLEDVDLNFDGYANPRFDLLTSVHTLRIANYHATIDLSTITSPHLYYLTLTNIAMSGQLAPQLRVLQISNCDIYTRLDLPDLRCLIMNKTITPLTMIDAPNIQELHIYHVSGYYVHIPSFRGLRRIEWTTSRFDEYNIEEQPRLTSFDIQYVGIVNQESESYMNNTPIAQAFAGAAHNIKRHDYRIIATKII